MKHVNAASARGGSVFEVLGIWVFHVAGLNGLGRNGRLESAAKHFGIQCSAHGEHRVAQNFGLNPLRTPPPQQAIVRIHFCPRGVEGGVLKID
jgi:hypothetical protein